MIHLSFAYKIPERKSWAWAVIVLVVFCTPSFVWAISKPSDSTLIEGAKLCTRYLPRFERQHGIPVHLLAAIASTESGRYHRSLGMNLPWPWTINVEGKGYFFDTKEEAVATVKQLQARGIRSIDVGCMQVNLNHHPRAFSSIEQALDPAYNVGYAAQFLKSNFDDAGSWRTATAYYHSRTDRFGVPYSGMVFNKWSRIINKVADAKAGKPIMEASLRPSAPRTGASSARVLQEVTARKAPQRTVRLREISVTNAAEISRERGVLVYRPESPAVTLAKAQAFDTLVTDRKGKDIASSAVPAKASAAPVSKVEVAALATPSPAQQLIENKAPQIVQVRGGKAKEIGPRAQTMMSKGQFEPRLGTASPEVTRAIGGAKPVFVFDN